VEGAAAVGLWLERGSRRFANFFRRIRKKRVRKVRKGRIAEGRTSLHAGGVTQGAKTSDDEAVSEAGTANAALTASGCSLGHPEAIHTPQVGLTVG